MHGHRCQSGEIRADAVLSSGLLKAVSDSPEMQAQNSWEWGKLVDEGVRLLESAPCFTSGSSGYSLSVSRFASAVAPICQNQG